MALESFKKSFIGRNAPGEVGGVAGVAGVVADGLAVGAAAACAGAGVGAGMGGVCALTADKVKTLRQAIATAENWHECFLKWVIGHPK